MKGKNPKTINEIAERVKARLVEVGMIQAELARRVGIDDATLSRFFSGQSMLRAESLDRIRLELRKSVPWPQMDVETDREEEIILQLWRGAQPAGRRAARDMLSQMSRDSGSARPQAVAVACESGADDWPGEERLLAAVRALSDDERETLLQFLEQIAEREKLVPKQ